MSRASVVHMTEEMCVAERAAALAKLGMTLEEARAQWGECGCCLVNGNWDDMTELNAVSDMDYLLGEGRHA